MITDKVKQIEALSEKANELGLKPDDVEFRVEHGSPNVRIINKSNNPQFQKLKMFNYLKVQR